MHVEIPDTLQDFALRLEVAVLQMLVLAIASTVEKVGT